jgi:hypothetical protein
MLSYLLIQKLQAAWNELDMTVEEGLNLLETLGTIQITFQDKIDESKNIVINNIPTPRTEIEKLFNLVNVPIPEITPSGKKQKNCNCGQQKKSKKSP